MTTYRIVRQFARSDNRRVLRRGMSREAAVEWCNDPESDSRTATSVVALKRTRVSGPWADFMYEEVPVGARSALR